MTTFLSAQASGAAQTVAASLGAASSRVASSSWSCSPAQVSFKLLGALPTSGATCWRLAPAEAAHEKRTKNLPKIVVTYDE